MFRKPWSVRSRSSFEVWFDTETGQERFESEGEKLDTLFIALISSASEND
jgi:hypothetical protein